MLFQNYFQTKVRTFSIFAYVFVLLIFPWPVYSQSSSLDEIVLTVNSEPVTESEIQRRINFQRFELAQQDGRELPQNVVRENAIRSAIDFRLLRGQAVRVGLSVTNEDIDTRIMNVAEQSGQTEQSFIAQFEPFGLTENNVRSILQEVIMNERLAQRVMVPRVNVRDEEIDRYIKVNSDIFQKEEEYNLDVISIPVANPLSSEQAQILHQFVAEIIRVLGQGMPFLQLANTLREQRGLNAGSFGWVKTDNLPGEVRAAIEPSKIGDVIGPLETPDRVFFVSIVDHRMTDAVSLRPVNQFDISRIVFQASNEAGVEKITEQMEELHQTLLDGADFAAMARLYSQDDDTRKEGGRMGWLSEDSLPLEYLELLSEMEPGDISSVQVVGNIVYLLRLNNTRMANTEEKQRSYVRGLLRDHKLRTEQVKWLDQLRTSASIQFKPVY